MQKNCFGLSDNLIWPFQSSLGVLIPFQHGPNQEPYLAAIFVAVIAVSFIMIGNLNALAPIVTMPFLLTYAAIDYAYFKLAMSYDIRQQQKLAERNKPKSAQTRLISSETQVIIVEQQRLPIVLLNYTVTDLIRYSLTYCSLSMVIDSFIKYAEIRLLLRGR